MNPKFNEDRFLKGEIERECFLACSKHRTTYKPVRTQLTCLKIAKRPNAGYHEKTKPLANTETRGIINPLMEPSPKTSLRGSKDRLRARQEMEKSSLVV